jgi:hypothetical protein
VTRICVAQKSIYSNCFVYRDYKFESKLQCVEVNCVDPDSHGTSKGAIIALPSELIYSDIPIAAQQLKNFHGLCGINLCLLQMHDNAKKCIVPPLCMSLPFSSHMFRLNCRLQGGNTYITKSNRNQIILQCLRIPNVVKML